MRLISTAFLLSVIASATLADVPVPLTCLVSPARSSDIGTDLRGVVVDVRVTRAQDVPEGAALVRIDTRVAEAQRDLAAITVNGLAERLSRSGTLAQRNLISRDEIAQLEVDLAVARAELARAALEIERATITAPFAGTVADVNIVEGELSGTEPLLTLIETDVLHAEMVFVDGAFGTFSVGEIVPMMLDLTGDEVTGQILRIDPFIDPTSNSFTALARIDNATGALPVGVNCRVLERRP